MLNKHELIAKRKQEQVDRPPSRRGSVLLLVLVVLVLLSLGAYTFSEFMIVEAQATAAFGRDAQARAAADSGVELAASLLAKRYLPNPQSYYNNPELFQGVLLGASGTARGRTRFSIVAPVESDLAGRTVRYGLIDESSKLNLNTLLGLGLSSADAQGMLMSIPQMTADVADAVLDFIDADQTTRQTGAEDEYYMTLTPSYHAKNAPLDSLDELLMVRGVTPALLYGEDANRNGLLDPNENDGTQSLPLDNADGLLQHGWSAYLTVFSGEINQNALGEQRINVNMDSLADLYDQVTQAFDEDTAKFIVSYRINGGSGQSSAGGSGGSSGGGGTPSSSGGTLGALSSANTKTATTVGNVQNSMQTTAPTQISAGQGVQAVGASTTQPVATAAATVTRGGIDVSNGGKTTVTSLYSLIGVSSRAQVNGKATTLQSPWTADPSDMRSYLSTVFDKLSISADKSIPGRININLARRELLLGIPAMTDTLADAIVGAQTTSSSGQSSTSQAPDRATTGWLVINGLTDLATLQQLDPFITVRGDIFRMQVVGFFETGGPAARIEAVIDATQNPPHVSFLRDLTDLGRGYAP